MSGLKKAGIVHFNSRLPIVCNIRNDNPDNFFSVELQENLNLSLSKGDPVVVGILEEGGISVIRGSIVSVASEEGFVKSLIILSGNKPVTKERRKAARIPTSLYAIASKNSMVVSDICISNITEIGMCMQANKDFEPGEQIEVDIPLREEVGKFECSVVRRVKRYNMHEYGMNILSNDESLPILRKFINSIQNYNMDLLSLLEK